MAKIYTKTGDSGETGLIGGKRIPKNHVRVEAYGTVDEANALIGVVLSRLDDFTHRAELETIQGMLFEIGAVLADSRESRTRPNDSDVFRLEGLIDELTTTLPPQITFILPGGTNLAAILHLARTVVRRAERRVITVSQGEDISPTVIKYLNRLSDYLHTLARFINHEHGVYEKPWQSLSK
ncbi:MAG: cob(I)yrinic acid a,c-diamide adenosyltransferase [Candidatus Andersenbacteria bacterium]